ncbi:nicotinate-nucleotide adenylyltransferase [Pigmentiphaga sp.]|uniref:nicotinate-nucleotide adenylyltransferase n=1 Tax=Pigmentiphaga sp. TaxID=1977564 RepID=UPI0025D17035|nr:nicotinate-nucleotide adenylyltransferase [Pigmentiphaga sp.]MBX6318770.1 nicotinate (nicotinamide) nucleotide adenylyltransferase [Pigmentiphaga sp.]
MNSPVVQRIGLLGGSFDPIHEAHVALARTARDHLGLESVHFIPAAEPWQRRPLTATAEQRAEMVALAIAGEPNLVLNRMEIDRGGPSYTIDTLRALAGPTGTSLAGASRYVWILGADQLANFCTWKDWQDIVALAELAVAARPGTRPAPPPPLRDALARLERTLHRLPMPEMAISSSAIRDRLSRGEPVDGLVSPAVLRYIRQHRLYQA